MIRHLSSLMLLFVAQAGAITETYHDISCQTQYCTASAYFAIPSCHYSLLTLSLQVQEIDFDEPTKCIEFIMVNYTPVFGSCYGNGTSGQCDVWTWCFQDLDLLDLGIAGPDFQVDIYTCLDTGMTLCQGNAFHGVLHLSYECQGGATITEALYGFRCNFADDFTTSVKDECDGLFNCSYYIDPSIVIEPNGCDAEFSVTYVCGSDNRVRNSHLGGESAGQYIEVLCPLEWSLFAATGNCNCGDRLATHSSGYETAEKCGLLCVVNSACQSFGIWTNLQLGTCILFDTPCTETCPNPTNEAGGYTNDIYNMNAVYETMPPPTPVPNPPQEVCDNGLDDDLDGLTDCTDSDCSTDTTMCDCATTAGQNCIFPFKSENVTYDSCTSSTHNTSWCATMVDLNNNDISNELDHCLPDCPSVRPVRLVGESFSSAGRIEILYDGVWGTVCAQNFGFNDADVLCRMMGFGSATGISTSAYHGEGVGPVWLSHLTCDGDETSVDECIHDEWGVNDCDHSRDTSLWCHEAPDVCIEDTCGYPISECELNPVYYFWMYRLVSFGYQTSVLLADESCNQLRRIHSQNMDHCSEIASLFVEGFSLLLLNEEIACNSPQATPQPTPLPTPLPTPIPTVQPTSSPTLHPIPSQTSPPLPFPSLAPLPVPTLLPQPFPTLHPVPFPTLQLRPFSTVQPTQQPSPLPPLTIAPLIQFPSSEPTSEPAISSSLPTYIPTLQTTAQPTPTDENEEDIEEDTEEGSNESNDQEFEIIINGTGIESCEFIANSIHLSISESTHNDEAHDCNDFEDEDKHQDEVPNSCVRVSEGDIITSHGVQLDIDMKCFPPPAVTGMDVVSQVVNISLVGGEPLEFYSFELMANPVYFCSNSKILFGSLACSYYDEDLKEWSDDGCEVAGVTKLPDGRTKLDCKCTHLTAFAIIQRTEHLKGQCFVSIVFRHPLWLAFAILYTFVLLLTLIQLVQGQRARSCSCEAKFVVHILILFISICHIVIGVIMFTSDPEKADISTVAMLLAFFWAGLHTFVFWVYGIVITMWAKTYYSGQPSDYGRRIKLIQLSLYITASLVSVLLIILFVFAILSDPEDGADIALAGSVLVGGLPIVCAVGFLIAGYFLIKKIHLMMQYDFPDGTKLSNKLTQKIFKIMSIISLAFLCKSVIVFVSADQNLFFQHFALLQGIYSFADLVALVTILFLFFKVMRTKVENAKSSAVELVPSRNQT